MQEEKCFKGQVGFFLLYSKQKTYFNHVIALFSLLQQSKHPCHQVNQTLVLQKRTFLTPNFNTSRITDLRVGM